MSFRLFGYWRSSSAYRVRIVLHHKKIPFENVPIHLLEGQQSTESFRSKNPMEQLPVLEHTVDGIRRELSQSVAIAEYLEMLFPNPSLYPEDPWDRALVREIVEIVNSGIQPLQNLRVQQEMTKDGLDAKAWSRGHVQRGLEALEAKVASGAGQFALRDELTMADAVIVPQLYSARRLNVDTSALPTLLRIEESCRTLEAFMEAHPDRQPDAVSS